MIGPVLFKRQRGFYLLWRDGEGADPQITKLLTELFNKYSSLSVCAFEGRHLVSAVSTGLAGHQLILVSLGEPKALYTAYLFISKLKGELQY